MTFMDAIPVQQVLTTALVLRPPKAGQRTPARRGLVGPPFNTESSNVPAGRFLYRYMLTLFFRPR